MHSAGTLRRLAGGMSGHAAMRLALVAQSVALVPILISGWGTAGYGAWLALMALGSYAGVTNFGLTDASGSAMLLAAGGNDLDRARSVFATTLSTLLLLTLPVQALVAAAALLLPIRDWLNLTMLSQHEIVVTILLIATQVWLVTLKGLFAAAIATTGRFGLSNGVSAVAKLAEIAAIALLVFRFHGSLPAAAAVVVAMAAIDLAVQAALAWRVVHWLGSLRLRIERVILLGLFRPSLGNLVLQLGVNAIVVQGPRVVLAALAGPVAVAAFAIHVTAARLTQQVVSMLAGPLMLEMSLAIGREDRRRVADLMIRGVHATTVIGVAFLSVAAVAGFWLIPVWTTHQLTFHIGLFAIVGLMTVINNMAAIPMGVLIGANRILRPAIEMTVAGVLSIAFGAALVPALGERGMAWGAALAELSFLTIILWRVRNVLGVSLHILLTRLAAIGQSWRDVVLFVRGLRSAR